MLGRTRAVVLRTVHDRLLRRRCWKLGRFVVYFYQRSHHRMEWISIGPVKVAAGPRDGKIVGVVVSTRKHFVMVNKV